MSQGKQPQSLGAATEPEDMLRLETVSISVFPPSSPREISPGSQDGNVDVFSLPDGCATPALMPAPGNGLWKGWHI